MNRAHLIWSAALGGSMFLLACGDSGGGAPTGSAAGAKPTGSAAGTGAKPKPTTTATTTATATATATVTAAASGDAPPAASGSAPPADAPSGASPLPADLAKLTDGIKDGVELKDPKLDGFFFMAPKGAKLESAPAPGAWSSISVDGAKLSFMAHAASDGGDGCPKLADMKAKAKGAKDVLTSAGTKLKPWGKKSLGDQVDFWMFEKDGKFGFYGVKTFEGKDKTTYCCAPGEQADAEAMKPVVDKAKAETLAGVCLSLVQKL